MLIFDGKTGKVALSQDDWKEKMLCRGCEHLISTNYEDLIKEVLYLRRKTHPIFQDSDRVWLSANSDRIALSLLSIFWRAAESSHPAFTYPLVPSYVREALRTWLLRRRIESQWHQLIAIKIQQIRDNEGRTVELLAPPFYRKTDQQFEFVFVCGGYLFSFAIPPLAEQIFSRTKGLKPHSRIVRIERINFQQVPEILSAVRSMRRAEVSDSVRKAVNESR
jgi:hypothetical protein